MSYLTAPNYFQAMSPFCVFKVEIQKKKSFSFFFLFFFLDYLGDVSEMFVNVSKLCTVRRPKEPTESSENRVEIIEVPAEPGSSEGPGSVGGLRHQYDIEDHRNQINEDEIDIGESPGPDVTG